MIIDPDYAADYRRNAGELEQELEGLTGPIAQDWRTA